MVPLPNPRFEPEIHWWPSRGGGAKSAGTLPKSAQLRVKNSPFSSKRALVRSKTAKRRQTAATLHVWLDFLVSKGPLLPSNSTIWRRNGSTRCQKAPQTAQCAPAPQNQERAVSWATLLKNEFPGHLVHPQAPTFYHFQASESLNEARRPPYHWSLGAAGGSASLRTVGANSGSTGVPGAKKKIFSKVVPRRLEMRKQEFLGHLEPLVVRFGPCKIPKCLEKWPFWDQQCVKNGSKTRFSKNDLGPFTMLKQVF